nr:retrovirus-related Pol polyprotein from transposon TNT 1-94 [Tanacetum cinerariifolium]
WAEAVNTACYVQNRVLVTKPHNKTPYALLHGRPPRIDFMRPFGCLVTILNTLDSLGKFKGKVDEEHDFDAKKLSLKSFFFQAVVLKFKDCSNNSSNEVNAAAQHMENLHLLMLLNLLDDPDMPELEDITNYDDENDVGAEANFNNLETSITLSPIPTTRIHKDHPVS